MNADDKIVFRCREEMGRCRNHHHISDSFFVFKQKTAYEMRISDWSSDVCSSDLSAGAPVARGELVAGAVDGAELLVAELFDGGPRGEFRGEPGVGLGGVDGLAPRGLGVGAVGAGGEDAALLFDA